MKVGDPALLQQPRQPQPQPVLQQVPDAVTPEIYARPDAETCRGHGLAERAHLACEDFHEFPRLKQDAGDALAALGDLQEDGRTMDAQPPMLLQRQLGARAEAGVIASPFAHTLKLRRHKWVERRRRHAQAIGRGIRRIHCRQDIRPERRDEDGRQRADQQELPLCRGRQGTWNMVLLGTAQPPEHRGEGAHGRAAEREDEQP